MLIVLRLLSRSCYCLVHFRPVDYCSSLAIVLAFLLFCSFLLFSRFGSTIACIPISRASAGSLYPSFGFNINLLSSFSLSLILLLLTLLIALTRHIGAWWCAITSPESERRYHRVAQTQTLGEAPLDPSLEPGPSRAVTPGKPSHTPKAKTSLAANGSSNSSARPTAQLTNIRHDSLHVVSLRFTALITSTLSHPSQSWLASAPSSHSLHAMTGMCIHSTSIAHT
jgi:hypothetical protein